MDAIALIFSTLDAKDVIAFRSFVQLSSQRNDRKDLQLFELYISERFPTREQIQTRLYPKKNEEAYQALRKRLLKALNKFISLKLLDQDSSNVSSALGLLNMARYLFAHNLSDLACKYLAKAERLAIKNELFEILNSVYLLQINYSDQYTAFDYKSQIRKWKRNKELQQQNELSEMALSQLKMKMFKAKTKIDFAQLEAFIVKTFSDLKLGAELINNARFAYNTAAIVRKKMMLEKDFYHLEIFLHKQ